jgi:serine/threonine protein kinase
MEYGGTSLTKCAYEIRGEFLRGERLYRVNHLPLMQSMKRDSNVLRLVLRQLFSALAVLAEHRVVHSDIKPDNILIEEDPRTGLPKCRFIDLGSAFTFDNPESTALATPEYMPPEALESAAGSRSGGAGGAGCRLSLGRPGFGISTTSGRDPRRSTAEPASRRRSQPWSFDIWSLGAIVLELFLGTPLWLSYKCRVADDQRTHSAAMGLFAVPGRDSEKILAKQSEALRQRGLHSVLRGAPGVPMSRDGGVEFLAAMLAWDPMDRISPQDALDHTWMVDEEPAGAITEPEGSTRSATTPPRLTGTHALGSPAARRAVTDRR